MSQWEYCALPCIVQAKKFDEGIQGLINQLNSMGAQGWEMVAGIEIVGVDWMNNINSRDPMMFFKRRIS